MQISVTGRHMEITDAIRDYAMEKVQHDLSGLDRVENVHVILDVEKHRHLAEIVVHAKDHIHIESKAETDNMYASIDEAAEKAERQLRRKRDKIQDHHHKESLAEIEIEAQRHQASNT